MGGKSSLEFIIDGGCVGRGSCVWGGLLGWPPLLTPPPGILGGNGGYTPLCDGSGSGKFWFVDFSESFSSVLTKISVASTSSSSSVNASSLVRFWKILRKSILGFSLFCK